MPPKARIRVLLTKVGYDAHDRGLKLVASALRDAGMEVIYTGPMQSVEGVLTTAIHEDVDVIGFSTFSGDHHLIPRVLHRLREEGFLPGRLVVVGGGVPREDIPGLEREGVARVFLSGTPLQEVVDFIREKGAKALQ